MAVKISLVVDGGLRRALWRSLIIHNHRNMADAAQVFGAGS
jgi:hypothetical protein